MEKTRGSRTVALSLFALVLAAWIKAVPANPGYGDVSLDPGPQSGRVDVYLDNGTSLVLGTICEFYWTNENSAVVCRQLGFLDSGATFYLVSNTEFDSGTGPIGDFECFGTETHLSECIEYGAPSFCDHSDDVVVYCQSHVEGDVRLVGGTSVGEGRVEVYLNGEWGTVCDNNWDINDATVVCEQLGHFTAVSAHGGAYFGEGSGPIWYDNVDCVGNEANITLCSHSGIGVHNCTHSQDAGVVCTRFGDIILDPGPHSGRVDVYLNDGESLTLGTICDTFWTPENSAVVCRQLGFSDIGTSFASVSSTDFDIGTGPIGDFECFGTETHLSECIEYAEPFCDHSQDVVVYCQSYVESDVRLVGGTSGGEGRVEVYLNGVWGTVCDNDWDINDATVVCEQLGHLRAVSALGGASFGEGSGLIWYDNVDCDGNETNITQCSHSGIGVHNCTHSQDAGVVCGGYGDIILDPGPYGGRVDVYLNDGASLVLGTICASLWTDQNSEVVCRQLGFRDFGTSFETVSSTEFGSGTGPISDFFCFGTETHLSDCFQFSFIFCDHSQDVVVYCQPYAEGDIRLVGGTSPNEGRVEVYHNGIWGTVCNDRWDLTDATVVCQQLGLFTAINATAAGFFGQGSGPIWYDEVNCTGSETNITQCSHLGLGQHDCSHAEDAGVVCGVPQDAIRLVGGSEAYEGRVEIFHDGLWGTVCDNGWDLDDAHVVCQQLGYPSAVGAFHFASFGSGTGPIWLDEVDCTGSETNLTQCSHDGFGIEDCSHFEDAGVRCATEALPNITYPEGAVRLLGGSGPHEGRVEVIHNGEWGTVCDDGWDILDATVVCHELGYIRAANAPQNAFFGGGSGPIWYDEVGCTGSELNLTECSSDGRGLHDCQHSEDAGVVCTNEPANDSIPEGTVRLVGGSAPAEGRVEVYHLGIWGTVCSDGWDLVDAHVVCLQLGYTTATQATVPGNGTGQIWYDDVGCIGHETSLVECRSNGLATHNCFHFLDAGVVCANEEGAVRLVNGSGRHEGRVEVYVNGQWRTVCDNNWSNNDAIVVCQQLGYEQVEAIHGEAFFGEGVGPIWYDNLACTGSETNLTQCPHDGTGTHNCDHSNDAGVTCSAMEGAVRLVGGSGPHEGRVEVFHLGAWGTVCDDEWDILDATVVCRQLGYTTAIEALSSFFPFGPGVGPIWYDQLNCIGHEADLTECDSNELAVHDCSHFDDAAVICGIAPVATISPKPALSVSEGNSAVVMCTATGVPGPTISWFRNRVPLSDDGTTLLITSSTDASMALLSVSSTLNVTSVMRESAFATITCTASNGVGANSSDSTQLIVLFAPAVTAISANQEVTSPDPVSFNCTVDSYRPSTITWFHNGAEVQTAPPRVTINTVQVDNRTQESTLTLLNTTAEDIGTYTCSAVNSEGMNNMTTELQVLVAPVAIISPKPTVTVSEGNPAVVMCTATGVPAPTISWSLNGMPLIDSATFLITGSTDDSMALLSVTSTLNVTSVMRESTSATITCTASNGVGANPSDSTQLIMLFAPAVTAISTNQEVTSPAPVSLNCVVDSYPSSKITWLHNGAEVQAAPPRVTISTVQVDNMTQESTLTLLNTTAEDTGTYTCSAVNSEGMTSMNTELQVLGRVDIAIVDVIPGVYDTYMTWTVPPCTGPTYEVLAQVGCSSEGGAGDVTHRSNKNYTTVNSLLPYTYYDFSVIAHCNATYKPQSHPVCTRTKSAPPTITNVSATVSTLSFTWDMPTCSSFLYEINITTGCESTTDSNIKVYNVFNFTVTAQQPMRGTDGQNASSTGTDLSFNSTSISGLQPGTAYGIKVRSFCASGSEITGYSDVFCAMTAEPDIECNSSVAFFALSQNNASQPVSNQLVAAIYNPISNGNTYFGIDPEDQLFLLKVNVLGSRGLLPFGTDYGGLEYEYSYSSSSYYGLQYTLPKPLPFFGKDQSILYVNPRGFISFGEPYLNPWSLIPFPLTGEVPMVAAFWWWYYTKVYVHSYQQGSSIFDNAVIDVVGDRLQGFDMVNSTFQPETLVSITWSQDYYIQYTAQMWIVSNGIRTFAVILFDDENWDFPYWYSSYTFYQPVIGYSGGDLVNFAILNTNFWELNETVGNTGVRGAWIFPMFDTGANYDAEERCMKWYNEEKSTEAINLVDVSFLNACPCTYQQALSNWRWRRGFNFGTRDNCTFLWWPRRMNGFRWGRDPLGTIECCYDDTGMLLVGRTNKGGTSKKFHFSYEAVNHITSDLVPYLDCCVRSSRTELCDRFYQLRVSDDCSQFDESASRNFGDPHFDTFDGLRYTFNGKGEFWLVQTTDDSVNVQVRLTPVEDGGATIITAVAVQFDGSDSAAQARILGGNVTVEIGDAVYTADDVENATNIDASGNIVEVGDDVAALQNVVFQLQKDSGSSGIVISSLNGVSVTVRLQSRVALSVSASLNGKAAENTTRGLLGVINGDTTDDFTLPDDTTIDINSTEEDIYDKFGLKWRTEAADSLFTYGDGEDHASINDDSGYTPVFGVDPDSVPDNVKATCGDNKECLFDYAQTQDMDFAMSTMGEVEEQEELRKILSAVPPKIVGPNTIRVTAGERVTEKFESNGTLSLQLPYPPNVSLVDGLLEWNVPPRRVPSEPIRILAYDAAANTTSTLPLSVIICGCAEGGSCIQVTTPNFDANNYYQEQCMCSAAYEGDFCEEDVDGCRQNPCQDPSLCEDVPAPAVGFVCTGCLEGYALNGSMCEDIDECASSAYCPDNSSCANEPGSFECFCDRGYVMQNGLCADVDECMDNRSLCGDLKCVNTDGGYQCDCYPGFMKDDMGMCTAVETCSMQCPGGECVVGENGQSTCVCRVGQFFDESAAECTTCAIGRYGFSCEGSCDCVNAVACDLEVGCVCEEGWTGPNCNQVINNFAPVFDPTLPTMVTLSHREQLGNVVLTLKATDRDVHPLAQAFRFYFVPLMAQYADMYRDGSDFFSLTPDTGELALRTLPSDSGHYLLTVVAIDRGDEPHSSMPFRLAVVFERPESDDVVELNVVEGSTLGTLVGSVYCSDLAEGQTATITTIDNIEPLSLAPDGQVTLVGTVDRETTLQYTFDIDCMGANGTTVYATVLVYVEDINDHSPTIVYSGGTIEVTENNLVNAVIGQVEFSDADSGDNGHIDIFVRPADVPVHVTPSGQIQLTEVLSYEDKSSYVFVLVAQDRGAPAHSASTQEITLNVLNTNKPPRFGAPGYAVHLPTGNASTTGVPLLQLSIVDDDSGDDGTLADLSVNIPWLTADLSTQQITLSRIPLVVSSDVTPFLVAGVADSDSPVTYLRGTMTATDGSGLKASVPLFIVLFPRAALITLEVSTSISPADFGDTASTVAKVFSASLKQRTIGSEHEDYRFATLYIRHSSGSGNSLLLEGYYYSGGSGPGTLDEAFLQQGHRFVTDSVTKNVLNEPSTRAALSSELGYALGYSVDGATPTDEPAAGTTPSSTMDVTVPILATALGIVGVFCIIGYLLVIILCCCVHKRQAWKGSVHQKEICSPGLEEAETSFENQQELGCVSMVFADNGEGEGYILQNVATEIEAKDSSPDLHGPRPHSN